MAKVEKKKILESCVWHLQGMAGKRRIVFELVREELVKREVKNFKLEEVGGGLLSKGNDYFKIIFDRNRCCYVGAESFGTDLVVGWDFYSVTGYMPIDYNETNEVRAFSIVVKDCVNQAVSKLVEKSDLDQKRVEMKSGKLGEL